MDITLDADQRELITMARRFVDRSTVAEQYDAINETVEGRARLQEFGELGWIGMSLPEEVDGAGASLVDAVLVLEEVGRGGISSPIVWSIVGARLLSADAGVADAEARAQLLGRVVEGQHVITLAAFASGAADEWSGASATGRAADGGWLVSGRFELVPYAHEADSALFLVDLEGRGPAIVHAPLDAEGIAVRRHRVIGGEARGSITIDGWLASESQLLSIEGDARAVLAEALQLAAVLQTASAVGAAEGALQLSVTWSKDREQFGRPIGSFQTVSNRCADMRLVIDAARLLNWEAAWALDTAQPDAATRIAIAKGYFTTASELVVTNAHQVHGAIGYSTEYPLHVLTRSLKAYQASLGTAPRHLDVVADALGL